MDLSAGCAANRLLDPVGNVFTRAFAQTSTEVLDEGMSRFRIGKVPAVNGLSYCGDLGASVAWFNVPRRCFEGVGRRAFPSAPFLGSR